MKLINHANVACGFHAGDPVWMQRTVAWAKQYGVTLGAHPGFPDLMGFGRRMINITLQEGHDYVVYQAGALKAFAEAASIKLEAAKPHGAFYSWGQQSEEHARAILQGFHDIDPALTVYLPALPDSPMIEVAEKMGFRVVKEIYPGLVYNDNGAITVKRHYGEEKVEEIVDFVLGYLRRGTVMSSNGKEIKLEAESVCVHGDVVNAPEVVKGLRDALAREGVEARSAIRDGVSRTKHRERAA
jgi:UPF0271 protein